MKRLFLKPIIGGVFIGTALFLMPFFILKVVLFFAIGGTLFRLFARGHMKGRGFGPNFADKIRDMSDEEYEAFKARFQGGCRRRGSVETDQSKMMI